MTLTSKIRSELTAKPITISQSDRLAAITQIRMAGMIQIAGANNISIIVSLGSELAAFNLQKQILQNFKLKSTVRKLSNANLKNTAIYEVIISIADSKFLAIFGFVTDTGQVLKGLPLELVRASKTSIGPILRGAYIARGTFQGGGRTPVIDITCPNNFIAISLSGLIKKFNIIPKITTSKNYSKVSIRHDDMISIFLELVDAPLSKKEFDENQEYHQIKAVVNRKQNFDNANIMRSVNAAIVSTQKIKTALEVLGDKIPPHIRDIARIRIENPNATLEELGQMSKPKITKHAVAGRLRRLQLITLPTDEKP